MKYHRVRIQIAALAFCLQTLHCPVARAQAGGINGPDQKGQAIPTIAEGEIPFETFQNAVTVCYKQAASKVLKIILGREIDLTKMEQNFGEGTQLSVVQEQTDVLRVSGRFDFSGTPEQHPNDPNLAAFLQPNDILPFRPKFDSVDYHYALGLRSYDASLIGNESFSVITVGYEFYDINYRGGGDRHQTWLTIKNAPQLHGKVIDRSERTKLGQIISRRRFIENPRYEIDPKLDLSHLTYWNLEDNDHPYAVPDITFDFNTVINCMKTQLSNVK